MTKKRNALILSTTDFKILETVFLLNNENMYPSNEGVHKILRGVLDDETERFSKYPTFKTLLSYSSKKISRLVLMLVRYHFLDKIFDPKTNDLYLRITELGTEELQKHLKKTHTKYKKKTEIVKPTIVEIK